MNDSSPTLVGYTRVSTSRQSDERQVAALTEAGCGRIFSDVASGRDAARPGLDAALDYLRSGDTLVVTKLDRLGRSLTHLLLVVGGLDARGVHFTSLGDAIDTTTPGGRLVFHVIGAIAEFERELIVERVNDGLALAKEKGHVGGRPTVMTPAKLTAARTLFAAGKPITHVASALGVSRGAVYRAINAGKLVSA